MADLYSEWKTISVSKIENTQENETDKNSVYSKEEKISDENELNRPSFRAMLEVIYQTRALSKLIKQLETKGIVVDLDQPVPLSFGGIAVLDFEHPENSLIPSEFDDSMPDVLTAETLIAFSGRSGNRTYTMLHGQGGVEK